MLALSVDQCLLNVALTSLHQMHCDEWLNE